MTVPFNLKWLNRKWFRQNGLSILLVLILIVGLSLLLYPTVSNWWNEKFQSQAVIDYKNAVEEMDDETIDLLWEEAVAYNKKLASKGDNHFQLNASETEEYWSVLNIGGDGAMGYIEIPIIDCTMSIYHGTATDILRVAAGHFPGSSLPIGGENTHSVLTGHRGLPSAKLFTDIVKLKEGDTFIIHILDREMTYEVDKISIVLPDELDKLDIEKGKDYCTLITCTPYGINSHRVLVRGKRIPNKVSSQVEANAVQINPLKVMPLIAVPIVILMFLDMFRRERHMIRWRRKLEELLDLEQDLDDKSEDSAR